MSDNNNGKIKFFNQTKGFGFITCNAQDIFFHVNDCGNIDVAALSDGKEVTFTIEKDKLNRSKATKIQLVG